MGLAFQQKLRAGFKSLCQEFPDRCHLIDGNRAPDAIAHDILERLSSLGN
jgi:dTMP kinase